MVLLTPEQDANLWYLETHWTVEICLMSVSAALMLPVYFRFLREWRLHHPIVQAAVTLLLPDVMMVANFLPLDVISLAAGPFASEGYCIASAFTTVASILASNAGVIYISYTTYRVIVQQQKKTDYRTLVGAQVIGWLLGVGLASYYLGRDYLGVYLGLYCCTKTKDEWDIVIPVFITFLASTATMAYFYWKTFKHIREVQNKAEELKQKGPRQIQGHAPHRASVQLSLPPGQPSVSGSATATATAGGGSAAATGDTPEVRRAAMAERKSKDLAFSMLMRGMGLIGVYYLCWFLVSLNAALALGGVKFTTLWPEMVAAWLLKLSTIIDTLLLWDLMRRAEANRRARGGPTATRVESALSGASAHPKLGEGGPGMKESKGSKGSRGEAPRSVHEGVKLQLSPPSPSPGGAAGSFSGPASGSGRLPFRRGSSPTVPRGHSRELSAQMQMAIALTQQSSLSPVAAAATLGKASRPQPVLAVAASSAHSNSPSPSPSPSPLDSPHSPGWPRTLRGRGASASDAAVGGSDDAVGIEMSHVRVVLSPPESNDAASHPAPLALPSLSTLSQPSAAATANQPPRALSPPPPVCTAAPSSPRTPSGTRRIIQLHVSPALLQGPQAASLSPELTQALQRVRASSRVEQQII